MSAPRQNLHLTWQRLLHATVERIALMSAAEQTRLSWAEPVRAADEIPEAYLDYLNAHLPDLSACLPAVLTPTYRGFLRRENEKLVFTHNERLYILEQAQSALQPYVFPIAEINVIEVGAILLKAWLRVSGLIGGQLTSHMLKYNSVTQFLFDPLVAEIRCTLNGVEHSRSVTDSAFLADLNLERASFDRLCEHHFKFMSYARKSLRPGERVVDYLMQPEMSIPRLSMFGNNRTMRIIDTAHLIILTDRELIVIRDDPTSLQSCNETRYGGVWHYLSLSRVHRAALEERAGGLMLTLDLPGDDRFEFLFATDRRPQAEQLCAEIGVRIQVVHPG